VDSSLSPASFCLLTQCDASRICPTVAWFPTKSFYPSGAAPRFPIIDTIAPCIIVFVAGFGPFHSPPISAVVFAYAQDGRLATHRFFILWLFVTLLRFIVIHVYILVGSAVTPFSIRVSGPGLHSFTTSSVPFPLASAVRETINQPALSTPSTGSGCFIGDSLANPLPNIGDVSSACPTVDPVRAWIRLHPRTTCICHQIWKAFAAPAVYPVEAPSQTNACSLQFEPFVPILFTCYTALVCKQITVRSLSITSCLHVL